MAHLFRCLVITSCVVAAARADDTESDVFAVYPVETDLQRALLGEKIGGIAMVDGDALMIDGKISLEKLETEKLTRALKSNKEKTREGMLLIRTCVAAPRSKEAFESTRKAMDFINHALRDVAIDAGYSRREALPGQSFGFSYGEMTNAARRHAGGLKRGLETPVIGKAFKIYPVHTFVSSWLTQQSDCVVFLTDVVKDPGAEVFSESLQKEVGERIEGLKLGSKSKLLFSVESQGDDGREAVRRFEQRVISDIAKRLGFENGTVRHKPVR